jgi:hypothetical protein
VVAHLETEIEKNYLIMNCINKVKELPNLTTQETVYFYLLSDATRDLIISHVTADSLKRQFVLE